MATVTLDDLRRDPAAWLDRVAFGEQIVVSRDGRAVAVIAPVQPALTGPRPIGLAAGAFVVPDDFDAPLPDEVLRDFEA